RRFPPSDGGGRRSPHGPLGEPPGADVGVRHFRGDRGNRAAGFGRPDGHPRDRLAVSGGRRCLQRDGLHPSPGSPLLPRGLRDRGRLRGGDTVDAPPKVFIGAAADPFRGSKEESFAKLRAKVLAGADFVQTQAVYDIDAFEEWMRLVRKEWLHEKVYILAGVIPLKSAKMARFMVEKLGAVVPKHIMDRMENAPNPKAEGLSIAIRTIKALKKVDGVRGVHLMPVGWDGVVPRLVKDAGLAPRPETAV